MRIPRKPNSVIKFAEDAMKAEGFQRPAKLLLWAIVVGQWMAIIIVGLVFIRLLF